MIGIYLTELRWSNYVPVLKFHLGSSTGYYLPKQFYFGLFLDVVSLNFIRVNIQLHIISEILKFFYKK